MAQAMASTNIIPGDTLVVMNGVSEGDYSFNTDGTEVSRITINFEAGAKIKGGLVVNGDYVDVYHPICYGEPDTRETEETGSHPALAENDGIKVLGANTKVIHPKVYDRIANGITHWQSAAAADLYGAWTLNNGWTAPDRNHGHGTYTQNLTGTKTIKHCIWAQGYSGGLRAYATNQYTIGFLIDGCVSIRDEMLLGSHEPSSDCVVQNCHIFEGYLEIGETDRDNDDVQLLNNYVVQDGESPLLLRWWANPTITGNTFVIKNRGNAKLISWQIHPNPTGITINNNTYYYSAQHPSNWDFMTIDVDGNVTNYTKAQWQALGYDVDSTFIEGLPTTNHIVYAPSDYAVGYGHVVIYNWEGLEDVALDLSSFNLVADTTYRLYNAMNPAEYHTFVSDGTDSAVSVPMTALDWTVAIPHGALAALQTITAPDFMTFVLEPA